jgi:molecular chaperone DnaJ
VQEDQEFRRDGFNVLSNLKVSYLQAILGSQIPVKTVDGETELTVPPGTQPGTVLTLEGKGVPRLGNPVSRGDHLITILVDIPTKVSQEERELLEKLVQIRGDRTSKGFLGGLFR